MRKYKVTYEPTYNGHPINANKEKNQGAYTEILDKAEAILDHMTENHQKSLYFRFDLRYPEGEAYHPDNKDLTQFNGSYGTHLTREKLDPHYLWAREQSREQPVARASGPHCAQPEGRPGEQPAAQHQHYHCAYLVDGRETQSPHNHLAKAEELWVKAVGAPRGTKGLVDYCDKARDGSPQENAVMLRRNPDGTVENYDKVFRRTSYLAKINTKDGLPMRVRQFGGTEVPNANGSSNGGGHERG